MAHWLRSSRKKSEADNDSGTVRSAVLALLGLLLGFSFAVAGARHEARRELLVEEANSIVTTARRAQLLPEPHAVNVIQLLREYVPLRIEAHREGQFSDRFATTRKRSAEASGSYVGRGGRFCSRAAVADYRQFHRQLK